MRYDVGPFASAGAVGEELGAAGCGDGVVAGAGAAGASGDELSGALVDGVGVASGTGERPGIVEVPLGTTSAGVVTVIVPEVVASSGVPGSACTIPSVTCSGVDVGAAAPGPVSNFQTSVTVAETGGLVFASTGK